MKESVVRNALKKSTRELLQVISQFPEEDFNTKPLGGGWTAGQVAEHLIKVETGTNRLFTGETKICDRDPEEKINNIRNRLTDFETKINAMDTIVPDDNPKNKDDVLDKLQDIRQRLTGMIELHDLSELITGFAHPLFGSLTRIEWIYFNIYHAERHLEQIKSLSKRIPK